MRNQRGFSLIEMMVAVGIVGVVGYGMMSFMEGMSKEGNKFQKNLSITQNLSLIEKYLSFSLPSGNIRFYSFSNSGQRMRSLYPLPGRCGDMSRAGCEEDTSLLFVKYSKTTTAALSTICRLRGANSDFIVDLRNTTYGTGTPATGGFQVSGSIDPTLFPPGLVEVTPGKILALFSPPFALMYKVVDAPSQYTPVQDPFTEDFPNHRELGATCKKNLRVSSIVGRTKRFDVSRLYRVKLEPLYIPELATGTALNPLINISIPENEYPLRSFNVAFETFGRVKNGQDWFFSINRCQFAGANLSCPTPVVSQLSKAESLRLDQNFKISLIDSLANILDPERTYEILSPTQSATCANPSDPQCISKPLILDDVDNIPYAIGQESGSSLSSTKFSMIKQNELRSMKFRLKLLNTPKSRNIYVFLP